jgi:hypothetical protein
MSLDPSNDEPSLFCCLAHFHADKLPCRLNIVVNGALAWKLNEIRGAAATVGE